MRTQFTAAAALLAMLGFGTGLAHAQQNIEWKQIINVPKGEYMPRGSGDILGIELGDSYADAKAKLQALLAEGIAPKQAPKDLADRVTAEMDGQSFAPPMKEERRIFRMQAPGASSVVTASFISKVTLTRKLNGTTPRAIDETIEVHLSAPSSGHQVIGITRWIGYNAENDQPRVSELMAQLKQKMGSDPQMFPNPRSVVYRFQFKDKKPFVPARPSVITCQTSLLAAPNANDLKNINTSGDCEALLELGVNFGISRDHASAVTFTLSDNERVKANLTGDFEYVSRYVRDLQDRTRGAPPKL